MVYAYDQWAPLPTKDLYNTQLMLASINAAKDMYDKAESSLKEYYAKYGDFYSPIKKDMDWYQRNVIDPVQTSISNMYDSGVDPLRSAEGRSQLMRLAASAPVGEINKRKVAAKAAEEYLKNIGQLQAQNKYDPGFEKFVLAQQGLPMLDSWDTGVNGIWTRTAPAEFQTLNQATAHWFDNMEGSDKGTKGGYDYFGIDDSDLEDVANPHIQGFTDSLLGKYYLSRIRDRVSSENPYSSPEEIENISRGQLLKEVAQSQKERKFMKRDADKFALMARQNEYDVAMEGLKHKHAMQEAAARGNGNDGNIMLSVFDQLNAYAANGIIHPQARNTTQFAHISPTTNPRNQWIAPVAAGIKQKLNTKSKEYYYEVPVSQLSTLVRMWKNRNAAQDIQTLDKNMIGKTVVFNPTGEYTLQIDAHGNPHYYSLGTISTRHQKNGTQEITLDPLTTSRKTDPNFLYKMEVKKEQLNFEQNLQGRKLVSSGIPETNPVYNHP